MRQRALVHIAGPAGAGKTTFIERLLEAAAAFALCIRAVQDTQLREAQESARKDHAELRRYRKGSVAGVALYRFPQPDMEAFFMTAFMQRYSQAVFIEGGRPIGDVDLAVFVVSALEKGSSLLRRVVGDHGASDEASLERMPRALESPDALARLFGEPLASVVRRHPEILDKARRSMKELREEARRAPQAEHWALAQGYEGIEDAQLVIVNVRDEKERPAAQALLAELDRLRQDEAVFREVAGWRGSRVPITAVVADLSDPKDAGLRKAVARVKRAVKSRES